MLSRSPHMLLAWLVVAATSTSHAADLSGPDRIQAGQVLILTAETDDKAIHAWILPSGFQQDVMKDQDHLVTIPNAAGLLEFILVETDGESIVVSRHQVEVTDGPDDPSADVVVSESPFQDPPPKKESDDGPPPDSVTGKANRPGDPVPGDAGGNQPIVPEEKKPLPPKALAPETPVPGPRTTAQLRPSETLKPEQKLPLVILYTMPNCYWCDKWKSDDLPKLKQTGWRYVEDGSMKGVAKFPSFEVVAGGKKVFLEGYQTAADLKRTIERLSGQ